MQQPSPFRSRYALLLVALSFVSRPVLADDWTQWRGPYRSGVSNETGLTDGFLDTGPPVVWSVPLGQGFSGVSVHRGSAYTLEARGLTPDGRIEDGWPEGIAITTDAVALDAATGSIQWRYPIGEAFVDPRGSGPRATPLVTEESLFVLGEHGRVVALNLDGTLSWSRDLVAEFGGEVPIWGYASSLLRVDGADGPDGGNDVVVVAGGGAGNALIALDPRSGETVWTAGNGTAGYASPFELRVDGNRTIVALLGDRLSGFSTDGRELWSYPWPVINNLNIASPTVVGDDRVFIGTSYDVGSALLAIESTNEEWRAREVWRGRAMKQHFHMAVADGSHLYGFDNAMLECVDVSTGEIVWRHRGLGKGSLLSVDGKLVILSERGELVIAEPSPEGFRELGSHRLLEGRTWTPPSLSNGQLYVRSESRLLRVDLRAGASERATDDADGATASASDAVAVGLGSTDWTDVESFRLTGRMHRNGILVDLVVSAHRDGRARMEKRMGGSSEIVIWNPDGAWRKPLDEESFTALSAEEAWTRRAEVESYARFPDAHERWARVRESDGTVSFEGLDLRRVATTPPAGPVAVWYLEPGSDRLVAATRSYPGFDGSLLTVTQRYSDHRPTAVTQRYSGHRPAAAGPSIPHFVEWDESETFHFTLEVDALELDAPLPDSLFVPR